MGPEDNPADDVQPTKEEYEAWEATQEEGEVDHRNPNDDVVQDGPCQ